METLDVLDKGPPLQEPGIMTEGAVIAQSLVCVPLVKEFCDPVSVLDGGHDPKGWVGLFLLVLGHVLIIRLCEPELAMAAGPGADVPWQAPIRRP
jgi:hypothetical protein